MAWIIALIVGGIIGLLYGSGISPDRRFYALVNFLIGAAGGVFGIWFFFLVLKLATTSTTMNFALTILWSIIGAVIIMAVIDALNFAVYRSRIRRYEDERMREDRSYARDYEVEEEIRRTRRKRK